MKCENVTRAICRSLNPGYAVIPPRAFFCLFITFLLTGMPETRAQHGVDYTIQANIIYRFTKYIDWPENKKTGDFIIGIVGDSPLYDALKDFLAYKTVGSQRIIIKRFPSSNEVFTCHILFISEEESSRLKKIAAYTNGSSTLLVTEAEGLARKGSCINFIIVDEHLKLEINKNNIERNSMAIALELLQLGTAIK